MHNSISDWFYAEPKQKSKTMQTGLVMGQTGYLQLPSSSTHIWRIPVAMIAEEGQDNSSAEDEDDEDEQGNDSEYTMIFI